MRCFILAAILATAITLALDSPGTSEAKSAAANKETLKIGKIVYEGGDGSSMEKAVIIKNASNEEEGVAAESRWISKVHPGWKKGKQGLFNKNGKAYDKIEYTTPTKEIQTLFFDITDFFGK